MSGPYSINVHLTGNRLEEMTAPRIEPLNCSTWSTEPAYMLMLGDLTIFLNPNGCTILADLLAPWATVRAPMPEPTPA